MKSIDNIPPDKYQRKVIGKTKCLKCGSRYCPKNVEVRFVETTSGNVLWWHSLIKHKGVYYCSPRNVDL